jgi:hypothetical protein
MSRVKAVIPSKVEFIGESCFADCESIREVIFGKNSRLKGMRRKAFHRTHLKSIELPDKCEFLDMGFIGLQSISVSASNPFFIVEGSLVFSKDKKQMIRYFGRSSQIVVPKSIEVISAFCFARCQSVRKVMFEPGSNLQRIDEAAFEKSGLKSIRIPSRVEIIGGSCFANCKDLTEVTFENDSKLHEIDDCAFLESGLTSIRVPLTVEIIGIFCFAFCQNLTEVLFENACNVQQIGPHTFVHSKLKSYQVISNAKTVE